MKPAIRISFLVAMVAGLAGLLSPGISLAPQEPQDKSASRQEHVHLIPSLEGADLFHAYCAPCHGATGTGNGPVASALNTKVPDLTTLARRHGGVFPREHVRRLIAGDDVVMAHGSRDMPIWGEIFHQVEQDRDYGHVRLTNVTKYIESLQVK